jgi:hypothetical protein
MTQKLQIDEILFLLRTQTDQLERLIAQEQQTTSELHKIITDTSINDPKSSKKQINGRWTIYSALANKLNKFSEVHYSKKDTLTEAVRELKNTAELLKKYN